MEWSRQHTSQSERNKRSLSMQENPSVLKYFSVLNPIEVKEKENENLKAKLLQCMKSPESGSESELFQCSGLLKDLVECAQANSKRRGAKGWRYDNKDLKDVAALFYLLGGLKKYQLMTANLPIPSISLARSHLYSSETAIEGHFRIKELKEYLISRKEPLEVVLSEDATKIVSRCQYDATNNQILGFTPSLDQNGCPVIGSFQASSAEIIAKYFKENDYAAYAYVIMAQPLGGSAPFCLCLFGTDNKFTSYDVSKRLIYVRARAAEEGIKVRGISADGDWRLLRFMRVELFVKNPKSPWEWFQANLQQECSPYQDFVHLVVKFKSKLTSPSAVIAMGPIYLASKGHIEELILNSNIKKDEHELTPSFLDSKDKMNFKAANKLCSEKVTKLLRSNVSESEGTAVYLDMMRETFLSCADPSLTPEDRLLKIWCWIFFLRIWRAWIIEHPVYTIANNCVTINTQYCTEINGHSMVQSIILNRDNETPHLFKPWHCSSQPCEGRFRAARSFTSTFSTVINFTIMEMLHRERRMDFIMDASFNLEDKYIIPNNWRAFQLIKNEPHLARVLPEDFEIQGIIENAFRKAMDIATKLQIKVPLKNIPLFPFPLVSDFPQEAKRHDDEIDEEDAELINPEEECEAVELDEDSGDNIDEDIVEDLTISLGPNGLKTFDVEVDPEGPFVSVPNSEGGVSVIKKSTLCWLLQNNCSTISNDRLLRVRNEKISSLRKSLKSLQISTREKSVTVGSWCAFVEEGKIIIGRVLAFRFMSGTSLKNQEFKNPTAPISSNGRNIGCMCSWFSVSTAGILQSISMESQGFYDLQYYVCTIPRPQLSNDKFKILCSLSSIKKLIKTQ